MSVDARTNVEKAIALGDTMPKLPRAGMTWDMDGENTHQCLQYGKDPRNQRPPTPKEIQKYRRTYQTRTGARHIHHGYHNDSLPVSEQHRYGIKTKAGIENVTDSFTDNKKGLVQYIHESKEKIYASKMKEPLGHSYKRGHNLPDKVKEEDFRFGKESSHSEHIKGLIYAEDENGTNIFADDIKRHLTTNIEKEITRPTDRKYNWPAHLKPHDHRFGKVEPVFFNGVAQTLKHNYSTTVSSKRQQDVRRSIADPLGRAKETKGILRTLGDEFVFGKTEMPDEYGVKNLIAGTYAIEDQMPDKDLGISVKRLSKIELIPPNPTDRAYGIPSIRFDLTPPVMNSVANAMNYGNEATCKDLLFPSRFAYDGVEQDDFVMVRPRKEIRELFKLLGAEFDDELFERLCDMAERDFGGLSADSFRHAWNKSRVDTAAPALSPIAARQVQQSF